jgi:iron only hydrogenase large subunit-like protein
VRLILLRYPDLVPHLIPVHAPRELAAKAARRKFAAERGVPPDRIGIFFITPCSAIMQSIISPIGLHESNFDGALSVAELYGPLLRAIKAGAEAGEESFDPRGLTWALAGGENAAMRNTNTLAVSGVQDVTYVFDSIEAGKFQHVDFLEAYICPDGCVSGQLLVEGRYAARRTLQRILERLPEQQTISEEKIRSMVRAHFFDMEAGIAARPLRAPGGDVREAIRRRQEKNRLLEQLPRKDCAACGAPDCATLAEDVVAGTAALDDCVFLRLRDLEERLAKR